MGLNQASNIREKTIDDQIRDEEQKITAAQRRIAELQKLKETGKPVVAAEEEFGGKQFEELTKEDFARMNKELAQKEIQKNLASKAMSNTEKIDSDMSKEDMLMHYKKMLADSNKKSDILEKQNTELKDIIFDKEEILISPMEYYRRSRLRSMKARIEKFKSDATNYPKNAVVYFMSMMKWRQGGKIAAAIKRGMIGADSGSFFTTSTGGINIENLKGEMKTCLERFSPAEGDSAKVKLMKKLIYEEIRTAADGYMKKVVAQNRF